MLKKTSQLIIISVLLIIALCFGIGVGLLAWIFKTAPDVSQLSKYKPSEATTVLAEDGRTLANLYVENRIYVPISKIPMDLQNAVVATEDQSFWEHHGINLWSIFRAIYVDIKTMSKAQGASTITQQLARNVALTQKKSFIRKIQEAYIAIQLERIYTKDEILEMYLNQIFWGHSARGVETAAQQYFGKDVDKLDLAQCAMLAGIIRSPNHLSPYNDMKAAIDRRNTVLALMVDQKYISRETADKAKVEPVKLAGLKPFSDAENAPYFVRYVRDKALQMFGADTVYKGGLKIYTTLDYDMQKAAEKALVNAVNAKTGYIPTIARKGSESQTQPQVSVLSIDPRNGYIKVMIGGRGDDKFNRTTQALRQPGSAFKPFVYVTALEQGYSPGDIVEDYLSYNDPSKSVPWPTNYNDTYSGPITLRYALAHSVNVATVRLLNKVGVDNTIKMAERLQITSLVKDGKINDRNLSMGLGGLTKGVSPIELAGAYGVFANKGIYSEPLGILRVEDSDGQVLYQANPTKKIVLKEDVAYEITDMLRSVVTDGTGRRAQVSGWQIAGKTGTTSDAKDAWFVGYTPEIVTTVWIGEDNPKAMYYKNKSISSADAAHLWGDYMSQVLKDRPVVNFERPSNIVSVNIDPVSGKLPNSYTAHAVTEIYRSGSEPKDVEQLHQPTVKVAVDTQTGQLATNNCPPQQVAQYTYQQSTGIRMGPATIALSGTPVGKVIYTFDAGVPVNRIDSKTGIPVRDANGNYVYQYLPNTKCQVHGGTASSPIQNIGQEVKKQVESLWDYFNP